MQKPLIHKPLIIASLSANAYAKAAVLAGYQVITLDAFADVDTQETAIQSHVVKQHQGNFDNVDFLIQLQKIVLVNCMGLVYGSGFDGDSHLLAQIAKLVPLIGNTAQIVADIKYPPHFFTVLSSLRISYPPVSFLPMTDTTGWLIKYGGGTGGAHIQFAYKQNPIDNSAYFQREIIDAQAVSLLFLSDEKNTQVIGFNQQLISPSATQPFRFSGVVSACPLQETTQHALLKIAQQLTQFYGLRGLNSLDVLIEPVGKHEKIHVLEVNPRLSASMACYVAKYPSLMRWHIDACMGNLKDTKACISNRSESATAMAIFYAPSRLVVDDIAWPNWVADIPVNQSIIEYNAPVCTCYATANDYAAAKVLLNDRMQQLNQILATHN